MPHTVLAGRRPRTPGPRSSLHGHVIPSFTQHICGTSAQAISPAGCAPSLFTGWRPSRPSSPSRSTASPGLPHSQPLSDQARGMWVHSCFQPKPGVPLTWGLGCHWRCWVCSKGPVSLQTGPRAGHPGTAPTGPPSEPETPAARPGPAEGCGQDRGLGDPCGPCAL